MADEEYKSPQAKWRARNPEKQKAATLRWRQAHLEQARERDRARRRALPLEQKSQEAADWRAGNPERSRAIRIVGSVKHRAKQKGVEFDPSIIAKLTTDLPENCPCCRLPFDHYVYGRGERTYVSRLPSLDRFDNTGGYTGCNVRVICARCNTLKSNATLEELRNIVAYMES